MLRRFPRTLIAQGALALLAGVWLWPLGEFCLTRYPRPTDVGSRLRWRDAIAINRRLIAPVTRSIHASLP